jgi:type III secretion protein S
VSPSEAVNQLTQTMVLVTMLSLPPIIIASLVGIVVSLLQALTQIQEQTVSFALKLIAVMATIAATASVLGSQLLSFAVKLFSNFPDMI